MASVYSEDDISVYMDVNSSLRLQDYTITYVLVLLLSLYILSFSVIFVSNFQLPNSEILRWERSTNVNKNSLRFRKFKF